MIVITGKRAASDCGMKIRRKGTDEKPVSGMTAVSLTADDFEEVPSDEPWFDRSLYVQLTERYVAERYSHGEESALCRKMIALLLPKTSEESDSSGDEAAQHIMAEFTEYDAYVEECKRRAKDEAKLQGLKEI